jgi:hypothetical protein
MYEFRRGVGVGRISQGFAGVKALRKEQRIASPNIIILLYFSCKVL